MFAKVLFCDDFSQYSQLSWDALQQVHNIKELTIIHVIDTETDTAEAVDVNHIAELLKAKTNTFSEKGIKTVVLVETGHPSEKILAAAEQRGISLIVLGAKGKSLIRDIVLGSVSSDIVRYGKQSVLVIRLEAAETNAEVNYRPIKENVFGKLIFATDFSRYASRAFDCLLRSLKDMGTKEIILTHILNKGEYAPRYGLAQIESENILKEKAARVAELGIKSKVFVRTGAPVVEINKLAQEEQATCVVVGARGKGYLQEVLLGSVAEDLIRNATLSVLVIKVDCIHV